MKRENLIQLLLFLLVSFGTGYIYYSTNQNNHFSAIKDTESEIKKIYESLDQITSREDLILDDLHQKEFQKIQEDLSYDLYVYRKNDLVFWSNNKVIPDLNIPSKDGLAKIVYLKNGYYIFYKKQINETTFIALSLLRNSYSIVNKYLNNDFSEKYKFQKEDVILPNQLEKGNPIKDPNGKIIFRVEHSKLKSNSINITRFLISILVVFFTLTFLYSFIRRVHKKFGAAKGLIANFLLGIIGLIILNYVPFEFNKTVFFKPELYASDFLTSQGFLFFIQLFVLGFSFHLYASFAKEKLKNSLILKITSALFLTLSFILITFSIKHLILDSVINFEAKNFAVLNIYALFGLLICFISSTSLLFAIHLFVRVFYKKKYFLTLSIAIAAIISLAFYLLAFNVLALSHPILLLSLIYLIYYYKTNNSEPNSTFIIFISLLFSVLYTASIFSVFNKQKNELRAKTYAYQKAKLRDLTTEDLFIRVEKKIKEDAFVKSFFDNPLASYKDLKKRLNSLYFSGQLSKYDVSILPFNNEGLSIKNNHIKSLDYYFDLINQKSKKTISSELFFIEEEKGQHFYLSLIQIENNSRINGSLILRISPKDINKGNVYPELLLEEKNKLIFQYTNDYQYAQYYDDKLISKNVDFSYPQQINFLINEGQNKTSKDGYVHYRFPINANKETIISYKEDSVIDKISIYSFILSFYFILGFVFSNLYLILNSNDNTKVSSFTLRKKINIALLSLLALTFFVIGIVTINYFYQQYNDYHYKRLVRKQKAVSSSLKYILKENEINSEKKLKKYFSTALNNQIIELSDIHKMDINIFDLEGNLIKSSQDGIFNSGLFSTVINPKAYVSLKNNTQFIQDEQIGKLNYSSSYTQIFNEKNQTVGTLNIPYFGKEKKLQEDISNLLISLVNVYILLLIIAIVVAFYITTSITNPLKIISKEIGNIKLTKTNEPIDWESDDEIGKLVKEYNSMIIQLEHSAKLLASKERDGAWREMAKQIAHEIKNPLTPMKLSIQHLQRTLKDDPEKAIDLTSRISKTLIEQIDNLTGIATAFSSFAKMPKADKETFSFEEILNNVIDLFSHDNLKIEKFFIVSNAKINADKNQLISVFNNIIKNAIQATEEKTYPEIKVYLTEENNDYLVKVVDNGVGISEDKKSKVFVPNFTTKSSGTGLGLAISKQIIENIYGKIWFESVENEYTIFYVQIPKHLS